MKKDILTSVKVDPEIFDEFKIECIRQKFSLNKLVNVSMYLYLTNPEFKKTVTELSLLGNFKIKNENK